MPKRWCEEMLNVHYVCINLNHKNVCDDRHRSENHMSHWCHRYFDFRTDGRTDGRTEGRTDGRTDRQTDRLVDNDRQTKQQMGGQPDKWTARQMERETDGRPDGRTDGQTDERVLFQ